MLADILPTGYEVGVLNGQVRPADVVAVVGAGPIGLAAITGAQLHHPPTVVAIDLADSRLEAAKQFGADITVNNGSENALAVVRALTDGLGADVAIEAVGVPATFELAASLIRPGGHVANIGVHGAPATLHLEDLWIRNATITTGLVDAFSTPTLLRLIAAGQLDAGRLVTHHFALGEMEQAYKVFGDAASTGALKVVRARAGVSAREPPVPTAARSDRRTASPSPPPGRSVRRVAPVETSVARGPRRRHTGGGGCITGHDDGHDVRPSRGVQARATINARSRRTWPRIRCSPSPPTRPSRALGGPCNWHSTLRGGPVRLAGDRCSRPVLIRESDHDCDRRMPLEAPVRLTGSTVDVSRVEACRWLRDR
jgi:hypothetical protein